MSHFDPSSDEDLRRRATRRANAKLGFRSHLITFVLVNAGLAALNLATSPQYLWFAWPLFGWGVGLVSHGVAVYGGHGGLREDMIAREMATLRAQRDRRSVR